MSKSKITQCRYYWIKFTERNMQIGGTEAMSEINRNDFPNDRRLRNPTYRDETESWL